MQIGPFAAPSTPPAAQVPQAPSTVTLLTKAHTPAQRRGVLLGLPKAPPQKLAVPEGGGAMSTLLVVKEGGPPRPFSAVELGRPINYSSASVKLEY